MTGGIRPGRNNDLTDVAGIRVGNAEDVQVRSGVTVILPEGPATAAVDVRGGAPGTRETDALDATCLVEAVNALVFSGGSAFGLEAASAVMTALAADGEGFTVAGHRVPIVPAAILFDLANGGEKDWGSAAPYPDLARRAYAAAKAGAPLVLGNSGAGYGALAGPLKGGLGSASFVLADGTTVAALAAVNSHGSALIPGSDAFWAWPFEQAGEFGGRRPAPDLVPDLDFRAPSSLGDSPGANTTLVAVASDAALTKAQAQRVAIIAQDGLARALRPVHSPVDGDSVFVLATGQRPLGDPVAGLGRLAMLAADSVSRAVARGLFAAETLGPHACYRARYGFETEGQG